MLMSLFLLRLQILPKHNVNKEVSYGSPQELKDHASVKSSIKKIHVNSVRYDFKFSRLLGGDNKLRPWKAARFSCLGLEQIHPKLE